MPNCTGTHNKSASGGAALVVATLSLVVAMSGAAVAVTGRSVILGAGNSATRTTGISNTKGTPISLNAGRGAAPIEVNSATKVTNLNADRVDGIDGSQLALASQLPPDLSGYTIMIAGNSCPAGSSVVGFGGAYGAEDTLSADFGNYLYQVTDLGFGPRLTRDRAPFRMTACRVN